MKQYMFKSTPLFTWLFATILIAIFAEACSNVTSEQVHSDFLTNELMAVETNPSLEEVMVKYKGMTISFNSSMHVPNWVAWEITADKVDGDEPRTNKFICDERVRGCADDWDYKYSGYDRGHMAPAADMKWDKQAMEESFYLTNICPQAKELNRGSWQNLEKKCRGKALADSVVIVICGPILTDPIKERIGDSRIAVPERFFKIILSPYKEKPEAIAFIMPNGKVDGGMQKCAVTIDSVESVTGHDFFYMLPTNIQDVIETQCNFNAWSRTAKKI